MPTVSQLYQFEEVIEFAAKAILTATTPGPALTVYRSRDSAEVATPYVTLTLGGVSADGGMHMIGNVGYPSDYSATLTVTIVSHRIDNAGQHAGIVGSVRQFFYDLTQWTDALLPYHTVWLVMESGTSQAVAEDDRFDETTLSFRVKFLIKETAWP